LYDHEAPEEGQGEAEKEPRLALCGRGKERQLRINTLNERQVDEGRTRRGIRSSNKLCPEVAKAGELLSVGENWKAGGVKRKKIMGRQTISIPRVSHHDIHQTRRKEKSKNAGGRALGTYIRKENWEERNKKTEST